MAEDFDPDAFLAAKAAKPEQFDPDAFLAAGPSQWGDTQTQREVSDIAKSGGVGIGKGLIGLAGLPGDVAELGARGINAAVQGVGKLTGLDVGPSREAKAPTYGSADITNVVKGVTGEFYKPQTTAGKYAEQIGEFAPAVIGGPGSLAGKALTRAVVPGALAETAGQAVERAGGSQENADLARSGVGMAAGLRFGKGRQAVPTGEEAKDAATALYQHPAVAAVTFKPEAAHVGLWHIMQDVKSKVHPSLATGTWTELASEEKKLRPAAMAALTGQPTTPTAVADLVALRERLQPIRVDFSQGAGKDRLAANVAIKGIDDFLANLKQPDLVTGNAKQATKILSEARGNFAAAKRTELADERIAAAELRASSTYHGQNVENALRQNIRTILEPKNKKMRAGWTADELAAARAFVKGTTAGNYAREAAHRMGGFSNVSLMGGLGGLLAGHLTGDKTTGELGAAGIGTFLAGRGLKAYGNAVTRRKAAELSRALASRSPLAEQWKAQGRREPGSPLRLTVGSATYGTPALDEYLNEQQGGRVEGYPTDSPEFKEEVRLALLRNPDHPTRKQAQVNRRNYLPDSPESVNIEDRRQDGGRTEADSAPLKRYLKDYGYNPATMNPLDLLNRGVRAVSGDLFFPGERLSAYRDSPEYRSRKAAEAAGKQRGGAVTITSRTGTHSIPVEIASTAKAQAKGLSGRRTLGKGRGMLFKLSSVRPTSFHMNNTSIPLDMIFIGGDGRIVKIAANRKPLSRERVLSGGPVSRVLEVAAGTARRLRLMPGDKVS